MIVAHPVPLRHHVSPLLREDFDNYPLPLPTPPLYSPVIRDNSSPFSSNNPSQSQPESLYPSLAEFLAESTAPHKQLVQKLNDIRDDDQPHPPNRLDTILADVFGLLSLFFLTIGKTKECPATYCQIASIRVSQPLSLNPLGIGSAHLRHPSGVPAFGVHDSFPRAISC